MDSKIAIVTGGSKGIGFATAKALAAQGWHVVITSRSSHRARSAADDILSASPDAEVTPLQADFADRSSIDDLSATIHDRFDHVDVLINNAAVIPRERSTSADGLEMQFAVNYLAAYKLTRQLIPLISRSSAGRVVNVTSQVHNREPLDLDDLNSRNRKYDRIDVYSKSKLALIYFTEELAERHPANEFTVNCVHPGVVATGLLADYRGFSRLRKLLRTAAGIEPDDGAAPIVRLATNTDLVGVTGKYFHRFEAEVPDYPSDSDDIRARLWVRTAELAGL